MKSKTRNLSSRKVSKKGTSRTKTKYSKKEPTISGSNTMSSGSPVTPIPIEEQCRDFFTSDGRLREVKYISRTCRTSEKEIRYVINGLKLQTLLKSIALQNTDFANLITPILNYINIRIEHEGTDYKYNYFSVKFDTKKHSKLDKYFKQKYCLTGNSKLVDLINYCKLDERDVINILLRNSLYKDPNAQVYREQVCSLINILKRDKFTPKDLKTIQKNCPHLFTEKTQTKRSKKKSKKQGKKSRKTSNSNSSSNSPKSRKPIEKNPRLVPEGHVMKYATTHNSPSPLTSASSSSSRYTSSSKRRRPSSTMYTGFGSNVSVPSPRSPPKARASSKPMSNVSFSGFRENNHST